MAKEQDSAPKQPDAQYLNEKLNELHQWIKENPKQTAIHITNGAIFIAPVLLTAPALAGIGFGTGGPVSATAATAIMSSLKIVEAGGLVAILQSAAMGGYGVQVITAATRVGVAVSSAAVVYLRRRESKL